jgi:cytochrome c553
MDARLHRRLAARCIALLLATFGTFVPAQPQDDASDALPERLSATGLYVDGSSTQVRPDVWHFTPQYALWSDGADKQRWIRLPAGGVIDASAPDAWRFPPGTRLWKEFSHGGRRIETRLIERRRNGAWRYASYVWSADGRDAILAPARGFVAMPVAEAPQGRYDVPAHADCTSCHEGAGTPVLGFSALQLAAPGDAIDLARLIALGVLRNAPAAWATQPPRIAAASDLERAALGYLHANCGHCHNRSGNGVPLSLTLAQSALDADESRRATLASAVAVEGRYRLPALSGRHLIEAHAPESSVLVARMSSRQPQLQMPPLGTHIVDDTGLALVERWIHHLSPLEENQR